LRVVKKYNNAKTKQTSTTCRCPSNDPSASVTIFSTFFLSPREHHGGRANPRMLRP